MNRLLIFLCLILACPAAAQRGTVSTKAIAPIVLPGPATVKQFGAKGDGKTDDTAAFQAAATYAWTHGGGRLVVPAGNYIKSDTTVFGVGVCWEGESFQSVITMVKDVDAFRTYEADQLLRTGKDSGYFDEDLIFERLTINLPADGRLGAALVMKQPGEAHCVRNLHINGGGRGIVSLGMGAPGLRVRDCTVSGTWLAAIYVQGWITDTLWLGYGGPASFIGVSGDNRRAGANAALIEIDSCYGPVTVNGLKAEGSFARGVIRYRFGQREKGKAVESLAAIAVSESTANINSADFLVLDGDGSRVPSAIIQNVNATGATNIIRNAVTGETVLRQAGYMQGMRPIYYP